VRLLWVTPQLPCCRSGGQVRQYYLLRHLAEKHEITVLCLIQGDEENEVAALEQWGVRVITEAFAAPRLGGAWHNRLRSWAQILFDPRPVYAHIYPLHALGRRLAAYETSCVDLVHFEHLFVAPLSSRIRHVPWVLAEQNVESVNAVRQWPTMPSVPRRLQGRIDAAKLRRWERAWLRRSPACIAVSEDDAAEVERLAPGIRLYVVPNGVEAAHFTPPVGAESTRAGMLFFGNLGYRPNVDAVVTFCREILPRVQAHYPGATLAIVGPHAPPEVTALGTLPGVKVVGFVDDVRPHLWQALVSVVPLRSGGGTRLKILESLAAGCPCASTTIGVQGLELTAGESILIADSPEGMAASVLQLLTDRERWRQVAANGRSAVARLYDWRVIAPRLELVYQELVATGEEAGPCESPLGCHAEPGEASRPAPVETLRAAQGDRTRGEVG
jgi:glycosyltransferase involved in cell wall biosynthesis